MSGVPYIRFFGDDWLSGTAALSLEERGALITLVALTASTGEPPLADYQRLSRQLGCTPGRAKKIISALVDLGKIHIEGGSVVNRRALTETEIARKNSEKQSENARSRWKKNPEKPKENNGRTNATAQPRQCQPEPEPYKKEEEPNGSSKKGSRLAADWQLPREWAEWAFSQGMDELSSRREGERFRDYWTSVPGQRGVKLDWQATWRNWVRRWLDERTTRAPPVAVSPPRPRIRARLPEEYQ